MTNTVKQIMDEVAALETVTELQQPSYYLQYRVNELDLSVEDAASLTLEQLARLDRAVANAVALIQSREND